MDNSFSKKLNTILKIRPKFFCINDVETETERRKIASEKMKTFFNKYYPNKPDYEK